MTHAASHQYEPPAPAGDATHQAMRTASVTYVFDRDGIRAVDRAAIEEYGIPGVVLMENAARGVAHHAMRMLAMISDRTPLVLIICGSGNNGGDGNAVARHLHNQGVEVVLAPLGEPSPDSDAGINRAICRTMQLREVGIDQLEALAQRERVDLVIDAIFGTGLDRPVSGDAASIIQWINQSKRPVLAVDVPSGMDCNTGKALGPCVRADCTVTFVGLKVGFLHLEAQKLLGEVVIADIGSPIELNERFGRPIDAPHPDAPER